MAKIISNEEYAKLTRDVDYWKGLALREESYKNFYEALYKVKKEKVIELIRENQSLDRKLDKEIYSEHNCNLNCFKEHVLPAIQRDYDSKSIQFKNDWHERHCFIQHWKQKLKNEYDFLESLYMISDTIMVAFKAWLFKSFLLLYTKGEINENLLCGTNN